MSIFQQDTDLQGESCTRANILSSPVSRLSHATTTLAFVFLFLYERNITSRRYVTPTGFVTREGRVGIICSFISTSFFELPLWWKSYIFSCPTMIPGTLRLQFYNNYLCTYDLSSPMHNVLDACIPITRGSWRGLGPVKWHRADRRVPFGAKKLENSRAQPPPTSPSNGYACIQNIMHRAV